MIDAEVIANGAGRYALSPRHVSPWPCHALPWPMAGPSGAKPFPRGLTGGGMGGQEARGEAAGQDGVGKGGDRCTTEHHNEGNLRSKIELTYVSRFMESRVTPGPRSGP